MHVLSSAYHPQSQEALERHHQTLNTMLQAFCLERQKDWDEAVPYVLFAVREAPTESLGFSPNPLVFGHRVHGPLDLVREAWCAPHSDSPKSLLKSVLRTRERLVKALEVAQHHLGAAQKKRKRYYDQKAKYRNFAPVKETTEVLGSKLVVPAERWGQNGVLLLGERLQHLGEVQKKEFDRKSEVATTGVKPMDKREGSEYFNWGSDLDQIEEQLNATPKEHFDTSAEIPEKTPEEGALPLKKQRYIMGARRFCFLLISSLLIPLTVGEDVGVGEVPLVKGLLAGSFHGPCWGDGLFCG